MNKLAPIQQSNTDRSLKNSYLNQSNAESVFINKSNMESLWIDSPCTISFTSKLPSLQKSKRFHYNSIYYRDDPHAPARVVDQFQKPDILLSDFRRQIKEANNWAKRSNKKFKKGHNTDNKSAAITRINLTNVDRSYDDEVSPPKSVRKQNLQTIVLDRLYPKSPRKLKLEFDRNGNRSSYYGEVEDLKAMQMKNLIASRKIKAEMQRSQKLKKLSISALNQGMFTQSVRIDLSRPQNFNPGPGSYFQDQLLLKKYHKQSEKCLKANNYPKKNSINVNSPLKVTNSEQLAPNTQFYQKAVENTETKQRSLHSYKSIDSLRNENKTGTNY